MTTRAAILAELTKQPSTLPDLCRQLQTTVDVALPILKLLTMEGEVRPQRSLLPDGAQAERGRPADSTRVLWGLKEAKPMAIARVRPPPAPNQVAQLRRRPPKNTEPHTTQKAQPIEILARMAGRSTFRTPRQPGAAIAVPVTPLDIAHAVATSTEKLGAAMAMAMACRRMNEWALVERLGYNRVLHHLRSQRQHAGSVDAPHTYRARVAMFDAFTDLVGPEHRRNLPKAAQRAHMRRDVYRFLLRETAAFLEHRANTAAADAVRYLFALAVVEHPLTERVRAVSTFDGGILLWTSVTPPEESEAADLSTYDINLLCQDVLTNRARRPGLLELKR